MSFEASSISYTIEAKMGALSTADKHVSSFNQRAQRQTNFAKLTNDQAAALQPFIVLLKSLSVEN